MEEDDDNFILQQHPRCSEFQILHMQKQLSYEQRFT